MPSAAAASRGLVLVVEDETAIAEVVAMYLRRDGFGVHVGRTGLPRCPRCDADDHVTKPFSPVCCYEAAAGTRTVDVHIAALRAKLGPHSPVRTVRGLATPRTTGERASSNRGDTGVPDHRAVPGDRRGGG